MHNYDLKINNVIINFFFLLIITAIVIINFFEIYNYKKISYVLFFIYFLLEIINRLRFKIEKKFLNFLIYIIVFFYFILSLNYENSCSSILLFLLLFNIQFFKRSNTFVNIKIINFFLFIIILLSFYKVFFDNIGHEYILLIFFILIYSLNFSKFLHVISVSLIISYLYIRPSTTIIFTLILLYFVNFFFIKKNRYILTLFVSIILFNFFSFYLEINNLLFSLDANYKELTNSSNNVEFRNVISHYLTQNYSLKEFLVGNLKNSSIVVDFKHLIPWYKNFFIPIHNDFHILIKSGGIVLYLIFSSFIIHILTHIKTNYEIKKKNINLNCLYCLFLFMSFNPMLVNGKFTMYLLFIYFFNNFEIKPETHIK